MADDNPVNVTPENGVVPHAGKISQRHISHHDCAAGDIYALAQPGLLAKKLIELIFDWMHPKAVSQSETHLSIFRHKKRAKASFHPKTPRFSMAPGLL